MTSSDAPAVTVGIATRGRADSLRAAVASIWAQSYEGPLNVVVVVDDDRVPDGLDLPAPTVPGRQTLRVVRNERTPGVSGARNTALAMADDEFIATCDDDDAWLPGRLDVQMRELLAHPDLRGVGGSVRVIRGDTHVVRRAPLTRVHLGDLLDDRIMELHPSALTYRRRVVDLVGGWDETLPGGHPEDYDLLLRLARTGTLALVEDVVADIHWNGGSHFFSKWSMLAEGLVALLAKFPEFAASPRGRARISGQIAYAYAAVGQRAEARTWLRRAWADNRREPRVALTALVLSGVVSADRIQAVLHARGRGI
ncbi:glycosyltransferase family 2 protein [Nocardioides alkalitolerans]|uniref:glycosyltransferase family 2 protein n=1 Tax=Nocardioides alkalitolerans TaxID=281714 RepID=UPI000413C05C|nr:glycosyltransferase family A protein [Nocardioides alkalitolerans]